MRFRAGPACSSRCAPRPPATSSARSSRGRARGAAARARARYASSAARVAARRPRAPARTAAPRSSGSVAASSAAACASASAPPGERGDLGRAVLGRRAVELERRMLVEPARVRLPDRAHAPVDATVGLAETRARPGARISRIAVHTSCPSFIAAIVASCTYCTASRMRSHSSCTDARRREPDRGGRAAAPRARDRSTRCTDSTNAGALRMRSPRIVTRLGKWPNNAENMLPTSATRSSGSHTTSESMVSPPGTLSSSTRRSPHVNVVACRRR